MGFTRASPLGAQSAWGQPWAGRAVTCPGADPGPVACPDLPPSWFLLLGNGCSSAGWGQAQPAPRDRGTYRGTAGTAPAWPVSCRAWAGRNVWILPGLLRPCSHLHLHFLPVRLDGTMWLLWCLHPLASWNRAKKGDTSGSTQPGSWWELMQRPGSLSQHPPPKYLPRLPSATQCPGGS